MQSRPEIAHSVQVMVEGEQRQALIVENRYEDTTVLAKVTMEDSVELGGGRVVEMELDYVNDILY